MAAAWIEVFKTGTHTSGNGITKTYTEDDLKQIAKMYNEQDDHEAPFVLGHPKTDDPAYGWAKELKVAGQKLLAFVDGVTDEIVQAVNDKLYKKVSIAIYPNGLLRHIGLLGATPPAVKGLAPVQFSEGMEFDEYVWVNDEWRMPTVARMFSSIREFIIEKFGLDTADKVCNKYDIETLQTQNPSTMIRVPPSGADDDSYSEIILQQEEKDMDELKVKIKALEDALQKQADQFCNQFSEMNSKFQELLTAFTTQAKITAEDMKGKAFASAKTSFGEFCETLIKECKVLPAEKDALIEEYADLLRAEETLTFAENETKLSDKMKDRLKKRTAYFSTSRKPFVTTTDAKTPTNITEVPLEFSEIADRVDPLSVELDKQIREYAEKHNVDYETATARIMAS